MITPQDFGELERLTEAIETNTASLHDYHRYEELLLQSGLSHAYIFSYLQRAGFTSWEDFWRARHDVARREQVSGTVIGGVVGLGLGVLLYSALKEA